MVAICTDIYRSELIGDLLLVATENGLAAISFLDENPDADAISAATPSRLRDCPIQDDDSALDPVRSWLDDYFAGDDACFDASSITLDPGGTEFDNRVWSSLCEVPFGETVGYGEIAARIGSPNAARAVGHANGRNPLPILVPCHRVIGASGKLTGFGGGLDRKARLLEHERRDELFPKS